MQVPNDIAIMAFDYGECRIGVAIGNSLLKIPHPLTTIVGKNKFIKLEHIAKLINEWQPKLLVIGMPDNNNQELLKQINRFSNRLKNNFKLPVEFVTEKYSSAMASSMLNSQQIKGRQQKLYLDQLSACNILDIYFKYVI
jgi:putative Holliday junction resolvase